MAIKCPKCNSDNPDTKRFCGECGTQLPSSEEISAPTETLVAAKEELTRGTTFAERYEIIEELGKGGMGKVYRVFDKKIEGEVALKLVKPEIAAEKKTIERFRNELKTAREIAHRNVCRMYDLNEEKGTYYITMEYVPGEDLKSSIRRFGQIPVGKTISIAKQVCEGLSEAHRLGVVHRDLKPNNIMIDKEGNARIMDFGIARSIKGKGITGAGVMIGTPEYMSPEQVEGKDVDQRSDIYSLGIILYEMVTGKVPFEGDTPFTVGVKHKSEIPKDPKDINAQLPDDLSRLILRCLEKDKEKRYQSAGEVRSELERIEKGIPSTERVAPERKPITSKEITVTFGLKKLLIPVSIAVALIIIAVIIWQVLPQKEPGAVQTDKSSIAVLPFEDLSVHKDQEILCEGMTDEIIVKLTSLQEWKVINRNSAMQYKNADKDIKKIGQELDVAAVLLGTVQKEEENIRVYAQLVNADDRSILWSDTYNQKMEKILDIQSSIAEKIARALQRKLSPEEKEGLERKPTENLEAYNLYMQGRFFWNKRTPESMKKAVKYFEQAIEKDSAYALAYTGLSDAYLTLFGWEVLPPLEALPKAKTAAIKAIEIDDTLAEAHTSLATIKECYDWDWLGAEAEFKRALELNSNYAVARYWYAQFLAERGRFDEAITEIERAQELDPLSLIIGSVKGFILYWAGEYDQGIEQYQKTLEMYPDFHGAHGYLGLIYLEKGMYGDALKEFKEADSQALIGITYARMNRMAEAQRVLDSLIEQSKREYFPKSKIALLYFALGQNDQGFEWLEKAYEERDGGFLELKVSPLYDNVRSDPRFKELLKKMGLEK